MSLEMRMQPFATAIFAKARALASLELSAAHRHRLLESISDDLKKASNFHPHGVSVAAEREARLRGVDLAAQTWHEQPKFNPKRKVFHAEHMVPVSALREPLIRKNRARFGSSTG